jgi:hypothetical protein
MPVALYRPRRPRASPLWQCLSKHREEFEQQYGARFQKRDGYFRQEVGQTLDAFEACGDLSCGFGRLTPRLKLQPLAPTRFSSMIILDRD